MENSLNNRLSKLWTLLIAFLLVWAIPSATGADCQTATVGDPFTTCFDIYTNAGLTSMQFAADNPGLDCSTLQLGQKVCISPGTLPSNPPSPSPNGTCAEYTTVVGDSCSSIALKFDITIAEIETFNANTFKWKGCGSLQADFTMCVSTGTPPPIPIIPGLQCGPQSEKNATCPLNVCCSAFGFCGLTDEFCTTTGPNPCISNCFTPTLPSCTTGRTMRKIAYYAGFGDRRSCDINISPDDIDWSPYTHVHFAFATITQGLEIQLEDADVPLLKQLVAQKTNHPQLKVVIAVGGWDFSELQPTRDLFSLMIASSSSRATFISSVVAFLSEFGLDGIDIDFEYPSAIERAAPQTDTPNLTAFFMDLRTALAGQIISCATPAGFWFLQGFEINKIADSVTYLNMMSYDYHGPWDTNITDQAPVTNPHTSILDMRDSALLYVRAGIDISMVNLGLAFYARSFQLADASCKGYNCTMVGGGAPGPCTATAGILAQFEVINLLDTGITPTLDTASETYWFDSQGSLFTFDQPDTLAKKTQFADSSCFGGTFIWSLDQNTMGLIDGSGLDSSNGGGTFTAITWNPNPFPSPGATSETFVQIPGTVVSTITTVLSATTETITKTVVIPPTTSTTTSFSSESGGIIRSTIDTTIVPASTATITRAVTLGSTVASTTTVTKTATSTVIPVPSTTTSVTIDGLTVVLGPGGTPINSPLPPYINLPNAITPSWTFGIMPPPSASVVTFTAPLTSRPTYSSTVPVPSRSNSPAATVTGPSGDRSRCDANINIWRLIFGGVIDGCLPADVGIRGGITPSPIRPPGWTGPWTDPFPLPTGPPPGPGDGEPTGTDTTTKSTSTSETSTAFCAQRTPAYNLPGDPENADFDDLGTDPDFGRKRALIHNTTSFSSPVSDENTFKHVYHSLHTRASPRRIAVNRCDLKATSPSAVSLGRGRYYRLDFFNTLSIHLSSVDVSGRPGTDGVVTPQEHVFELGYIDQFFKDSQMMAMSCTWVENNIFNYRLINGMNLGDALVGAIDNTNNMVWVDLPMNQAKSNVVNRNRDTSSNPPQGDSISSIGDFTLEEGEIYDVEWFIRNLAALGQYFDQTSGIFKATALSVQNLLSEVTPDAVPDASQSIPLIFNNWLSDLIATYPSGCVSRAMNSFNAYRQRMQEIATEDGTIIPDCFRLAVISSTSFIPSGFTAQDLIPPAPTSARCNVPGTAGNIGYVSGSTTVTSIPFTAQQVVMGSGNTNYYAIGSGASLSGTNSRFVAIDLGPVGGSACNGVSALNDLPPQQGTTVNVAFQCNGGTGRRDADFNFVLNGQQLGCVVSLAGHPGGVTTTIICATSQGNAMACANSAFASTSILAVQMRFFPV